MEENEVNLTTKDSNTSIVSDINKLEIDSQNSENINEISSCDIENPLNLSDKISSQIDQSLNDENKTEKETVSDDEQTSSQVDNTQESSQISEAPKESDQTVPVHDSSPSSDSQVTTSSSGISDVEQPEKRKRKRKRRRKRKAINAYVPDEPFTKRYKKVMDFSLKPKLHVKFDDSGNIVSYQNNYKPRIIAALPKNLPINDCPKENKIEQVEEKIHVDKCDELLDKPKVSLKPRIIKAIGT